MQDLIKEGIIIEKDGFQSISYILNDEKRFILSNYKIMQSMEKDGLIRCNKILNNGKVKLVYGIGEMKTLDVLCRYMHYSEFISVLDEILGIVLKVDENGFLNASNLDCSPEHIFVDNENLRPHVMYFPLISEQNSGMVSDEIRTNLTKAIEIVPLITTEERNELYNCINDQTLNIQKMKAILHSKINGVPACKRNVMEVAKGYEIFQPAKKMKLKSMNSTQKDLDINKTVFTIGKLANAVDGLVSNVTVSRKHCVITSSEGIYYIEDLDSTNGTKINGIRIQSHKKKQINSGDIIKIADVKFQVEI